MNPRREGHASTHPHRMNDPGMCTAQVPKQISNQIMGYTLTLNKRADTCVNHGARRNCQSKSLYSHTVRRSQLPTPKCTTARQVRCGGQSRRRRTYTDKETASAFKDTQTQKSAAELCRPGRPPAWAIMKQLYTAKPKANVQIIMW